MFVPDLTWIRNLKVGDQALNCFGKLATVAEITYRGTDVGGKEFVGVYLKFGENSTISQSFKEGESVRTTKDEVVE